MNLFSFILKEFLSKSHTVIFGFCIGEYLECPDANCSKMLKHITVFKDYTKKYCLNGVTPCHCVKYCNSPNFLMYKYCEKAQFPHSFGGFAQNYAGIVPFYKMSTPESYVKLQYFMLFYDSKFSIEYLKPSHSSYFWEEW